MNEYTLYNYSSLKKRDNKIYSIGGTAIPGGLSFNFTKVVAPVALLFLILGLVIGKIIGKNTVLPLQPEFAWKWDLIWLAIGILIGEGLWKIEFAGYKLYQYLIAYLKPKKAYKNDPDVRKRVYHLTNIKIDTVVTTIL